MKLTNGQMAMAYGVGTYITNVLLFLANIFSITIFNNMLAAICLTTLAMYLSILLNYKKYNLMKDKTTVSFFRIVIIDAIVMLLGYIYIILMNEEGYLDLTTCILPPLTMIPLIKTNKKIKLD